MYYLININILLIRYKLIVSIPQAYVLTEEIIAVVFKFRKIIILRSPAYEVSVIQTRYI